MEQILPVSDLQHKTKKILEMIRETGDSVVVTQNGHPAVVVMDYESYEGWKVTMEEMRELDAQEKLARAEKDVKAGRLTSFSDFVTQLSKKSKRGNSTHRRSKK